MLTFNFCYDKKTGFFKRKFEIFLVTLSNFFKIKSCSYLISFVRILLCVLCCLYIAKNNYYIVIKLKVKSILK